MSLIGTAQVTKSFLKGGVYPLPFDFSPRTELRRHTHAYLHPSQVIDVDPDAFVHRVCYFYAA
jgi:hypothetical protein